MPSPPAHHPLASGSILHLRQVSKPPEARKPEEPVVQSQVQRYEWDRPCDVMYGRQISGPIPQDWAYDQRRPTEGELLSR